MDREIIVRLASFIAVSLAMAAWETVAPRRQRIVSRAIRWPIGARIRNEFRIDQTRRKQPRRVEEPRGSRPFSPV